MQKVISINLNGNAYQLDEGGFETLREYLAGAERQLGGNPDRAEVMADLEQAIADKCAKFLGPHKSVVSASEIEQIVAEMGPVEVVEGQKDGDAGTGERAGSTEAKEPPRRLFRIPSGQMIAGVCTGLAAYFRIDVTLVRIVFVIAALLTKGAAIVAYIAMMFVVPEATTAEEQAAAGGQPFNAKEVIDRAKARSANVGREWRRHWMRQQRQWRRRWAAPGAMPVYAFSPVMAAMMPVFALAHMALFLLMMAMLISLVNTGGVFNWPLPPDVPVWAAALILLVAYQIVVSPLRAVGQWGLKTGGVEQASFAFWKAVVWLIGLAFAIWLASDHIPEIRTFVQRVPDLIREFAWAVRDLFNKPQ